MVKAKRRWFPAMKKYQVHLMMLIFIPSVIMHLSLFGLLTLMHLNLFDLLIDKPYSEIIGKAIDVWSVRLLVISGGLITLYLIVAFFVSRNLIGAFNRIINELDQILEGKKKGPLFVRKYDGLASEVLKRVNAILVKVPDHYEERLEEKVEA